ncbi:MAG TPA: phytoene/squalene synthase family protein [Flexivirga sp.]|uniref:phytoene/squalene synthase family protein n=1 Tax=Flexivirga sp. TaxID=1962927 RepID=UPI002C294A6F|nr:phytoene/squalene synthase family protein [Flexivirga sp.]HWC20749.1 phytoene/squalene synthase family protein [Flexivirga sp.]
MDELSAAYRTCRRINALHGRSFYRATSLLPPGRRPHIWALYAVARRSDDLVDAPAAGTDPAKSLRQWESEVMRAVSGGSEPTDPVLRALRHTVRIYDIRPRLFAEFFESMRRDLTTTRYATWDDLRTYMRGSAAVIGEMTAPILGSGPPGLPYAAALGEAFQLTNFIRDIAEDWQRGRIYLPLEDFRTAGCTEDDLGTCVATGTSSPALRRLVAFEIARARTLYDAAQPGLAEVDTVVRPCLRTAFGLYSEILREIERRDFEVCRGRVVVPAARRAVVLSRSLAGGRPWRSTSATTRW